MKPQPIIRFPSIGILFVVLILLNGCSESSEKAAIPAVKSVAKKHFQDTHPTFRHWKNYYTTLDSTLSDLAFTRTSVKHVSWMNGSIPATFDKEFDPVYLPFLVYSPDKTSYIDFDSYQWELINGEPQFEADQEVNLVNVQKRTVQRLAFRGPSSQIEDVYWMNNHTVVLLENFDSGLYVHVFDLKKQTETTFTATKTSRFNSSYATKRLERLLAKNNPTNSHIPRNQNCFCEQDAELLDIRCEPIIFDNNAQLRWHYNCDSVWLTFEKPGKRKKTLFTLPKEMRDYAGDLGYVDFIEYKTTFLAENKPISGCCAPMNYDLFHKSTGKLIRSFGNLIHYSEDRKYPVVVQFDAKTGLVITNLESRKRYTYQLSKRDIDHLLAQEDPLFPDDIFQTIKQKGNVLTITYEDEHNKLNSIALQLRNYR